MRVEDIMHPHPATVDVSDSVATALHALQRLDVRHLPVLEATRLVGMVSDRDVGQVSTPALLPSERRDLLEMSVRNLMSPHPVTVEPQTTLGRLIEVLVHSRVGAVPVVADGKVLVGIVSYIDVLRALGPSVG